MQKEKPAPSQEVSLTIGVARIGDKIAWLEVGSAEARGVGMDEKIFDSMVKEFGSGPFIVTDIGTCPMPGDMNICVVCLRREEDGKEIPIPLSPSWFAKRNQ